MKHTMKQSVDKNKRGISELEQNPNSENDDRLAQLKKSLTLVLCADYQQSKL